MKPLGLLDVNPTPFKAVYSPLRDLSHFAGKTKLVRIDPAHTYAIDGIGKNFCASSIVLLMNMGWFGGGNADVKFHNAYARFMAYCDARDRRTSIHEFSYKTFKLPVGSFPVCMLPIFTPVTIFEFLEDPVFYFSYTLLLAKGCGAHHVVLVKAKMLL